MTLLLLRFKQNKRLNLDNMESRIGWLHNTSGDEIPVDPTLITDTSGELVDVTPQQLEQILANDPDSILQLMAWGSFQSRQEAEAFLAESEQAS